MNEAVTRAAAPDARAEALVASYERAGYARVAPALLQPAEPFLDLSGEDIRRRMYVTTDPSGAVLRPRHVVAPAPVGARVLPAPRSHHSGVARLSRLAARRQAGRLLLSWLRLPSPRRRPERIHAGRHRELRPHRHRRDRRGDAGAWARSGDALRRRCAGDPH